MTGKDLRIVFMGTPGFAVESLKALVENGYNIVGVITVPDKPAGRGQKIRQSDVKVYAESQGLHIMQPEKLKEETFVEELRALKADLQIVVAFRMLPEIVWNMPRLGTFNLHASLLPRYRGAAPLNWAIINGDKQSGVTTFLLKHEIDTGNVLYQERTPIGRLDTIEDLHDSCMNIGAKLVLKTTDALANGSVSPKSQDEITDPDLAPKHAPKIFKEDCRISWDKDSETIHNLIRGLSPYPAAWTEFTPLEEGKKLISAKLFKTDFEISSHDLETGTIVCDGKKELKVATLDGFIHVYELQLAGKKRMKTEDFLRGFQQISSYCIK